MASILLVIFAVEVAVVIINAVGAETINNVLWFLLNYFPIPSSKLAAEQKKVQAEYLRARRELKSTSSQDEFAKWAKLRRQHDKLLEQLEKTKKSIDSARANFDVYLTGIRFLLTRAPQWILPMAFASQPVFWLPHNFFPHAIEWLVALPRAPTGSVSTATWQVACAVVVGLVADLVTALLGGSTTTTIPGAIPETRGSGRGTGSGSVRERNPGFGSVRERNPGFGSVRERNPGFGSVREKSTGFGSVGEKSTGFSSVREKSTGFGSVRGEAGSVRSVRSAPMAEAEAASVGEEKKEL